MSAYSLINLKRSRKTIGFISKLVFISLFIFVSGCKEKKETAQDKPNIIIILADDMGYSDIGCYGSEINTPNIDELAANGIRFTRFYNTARCSPSRASLLTGLYPHQAGVGYLTSDHSEERRRILGAPGYMDYLTNNSVTIAEVLKTAGYKTYLSGKWHVGQNRPHWPYYRGFDQSVSVMRGYHYFTPEKNEYVYNDSLYQPDPDNFYATDFFTDHAVEFISEHPQDSPFFLYLAYTAPHFPIHAPEEEVTKYTGKFMIGWDSLRIRTYQRMKEIGLIENNRPLTPTNENIPSWNSLTDEEKKMWDRKMAVYAAQISIMDRGIGRVSDILKEKGLFENTLIMFLSDNGPSAERIFRTKPGAVIGSADSYESYGAWANLSNVPFRLFKRYTHEGGIATPFIAHWPAGITRNSNDFIKQPSHIIDIMNTCIDVAEGDYPEQYNGNEIKPTPGKSLVPYFNGDNPLNHQQIYWEHEGNRGILDGKWKLVSILGEPWELYNIEEDGVELNDLAEAYPEKVKEMSSQWQDWADRAGVVPWIKTGFKPEIYDYKKYRRE